MNRSSIKFNDLPALKDLACDIIGVSKSILSVGTPGENLPQYCLNLALSFWNLTQGKLQGVSVPGNLSLKSRSRGNLQKDKCSYYTLQTIFMGELLQGFKQPEINSSWFVDWVQWFIINMRSGLIPLGRVYSLITTLLAERVRAHN